MYVHRKGTAIKLRVYMLPPLSAFTCCTFSLRWPRKIIKCKYI